MNKKLTRFINSSCHTSLLVVYVYQQTGIKAGKFRKKYIIPVKVSHTLFLTDPMTQYNNILFGYSNKLLISGHAFMEPCILGILSQI